MEDEFAREQIAKLLDVSKKQLKVEAELSAEIEQLRNWREHFDNITLKFVEILQGILEKKRPVRDLLEEVQRARHLTNDGLAEEAGIDKKAFFNLQAGRHVSDTVMKKASERFGIPFETLAAEQPPKRKRRRRAKARKPTH